MVFLNSGICAVRTVVHLADSSPSAIPRSLIVQSHLSGTPLLVIVIKLILYSEANQYNIPSNFLFLFLFLILKCLCMILQSTLLCD